MESVNILVLEAVVVAGLIGKVVVGWCWCCSWREVMVQQQKSDVTAVVVESDASDDRKVKVVVGWCCKVMKWVF
jgi:hypothetical protein